MPKKKRRAAGRESRKAAARGIGTSKNPKGGAVGLQAGGGPGGPSVQAGGVPGGLLAGGVPGIRRPSDF